LTFSLLLVTTTADLETLIVHSLKALEGPANDKDVAVENASVAVLGKNQTFEILEGDALKSYLDQLESTAAGMDTE